MSKQKRLAVLNAPTQKCRLGPGKLRIVSIVKPKHNTNIASHGCGHGWTAYRYRLRLKLSEIIRPRSMQNRSVEGQESSKIHWLFMKQCCKPR